MPRVITLGIQRMAEIIKTTKYPCTIRYLIIRTPGKENTKIQERSSIKMMIMISLVLLKKNKTAKM